MPNETPDATGYDTICVAPTVTVEFLPLSLAEFMGLGGAEILSVDLSRSTVGLPTAGFEIELTVRNSAGAQIAQQDFSAALQGGDIVAANAAAVNAFLQANLTAGGTSVDIDLAPIPVQSIEGENTFIADVQVSGVTVASRGELWYNAGCEYSGSNACGAGY